MPTEKDSPKTSIEQERARQKQKSEKAEQDDISKKRWKRPSPPATRSPPAT